jgi:hypothetical protein
VHVLQHLGGGVAPWNVQQYDLSDPRFEVVFYHFHGLKFIQDQMVNLGKYKYTPAVLSRVYQPYISHIERINAQLVSISPVFSQNLSVVNQEIISPLRKFARSLKGHYHVYKKSKFLCQN